MNSLDKNQQKELEYFRQEALGNPWVLGAILERELLIEEIAHKGGILNASDEYSALPYVRGQAELRKALVDSSPRT